MYSLSHGAALAVNYIALSKTEIIQPDMFEEDTQDATN